MPSKTALRSPDNSDLAMACAVSVTLPAAGAARPFSAAIAAATSASDCAQPEASDSMLCETGMAQASADESCDTEAMALTRAPRRTA